MRKTTKIIKRRKTIRKVGDSIIKTTITTTKISPRLKKLQKLLDRHGLAKAD